MIVVFRVDSSNQIGSGHLMRCLRLASYLETLGYSIYFITRELPGNVSYRLRDVGFSVSMLTDSPKGNFSNDLMHSHWLGTSWEVDARQTIQALSGINPNWIIIDHYSLDIRWEKQIKSHFPNTKLFVIDDIADRSHDCHLLLDQNFFPQPELRYKSLLPDITKRLLGPSYALIDKVYSALHVRAMDSSPKTPASLLVFFGSGDVGGLTLKVTKALKENRFPTKIVLTVIASKQSVDYLELVSFSRMNRINFFEFVEGFPQFLSNFDIMIGAGGSTSWERASLGIPSIIYSVAENQVELSQCLSNYGAVKYMGLVREFSEKKLIDVLFDLVADKGCFQTIRQKNLDICDGRGLERVAEAMKKMEREND